MYFIGIVWAIIAPVMLLPLILLVALVMRPLGRKWALSVATVLVLAPVIYIYSQDLAEFKATCTGVSPPTIADRATAEGIYLNSGTANSFGNRYLREEGFSWLERQDIYDRSTFVRVTLDPDNRPSGEKIPAITARYEVRELFEQRPPDLSVSLTEIVDRQTGLVMARAEQVRFGGGRMKWVLGAHGSGKCPDPRFAPDFFHDYYHLARNTLRPDTK